MQKKKLLEGAAGEEMKKKWKRMTSASDAAKNFIRRKKLKWVADLLGCVVEDTSICIMQQQLTTSAGTSTTF